MEEGWLDLLLSAEKPRLRAIIENIVTLVANKWRRPTLLLAYCCSKRQVGHTGQTFKRFREWAGYNGLSSCISLVTWKFACMLKVVHASKWDWSGPYLSPLLAEETTEGPVESICKGQFQLYSLQSPVQNENADLLIKILKSISRWQQHNIKRSIEPFEVGTPCDSIGRTPRKLAQAGSDF